jgi:16S rRNA (uracil1498-N3)-methyltransferase
MAVHHFFTSPENVGSDRLTITGDEAHHAARSLRLKTGERITVADGSGRVYDATVTSVGEAVEADITAARDAAPPRPSITIHQALMKGDRMDDVIDRCAEIGVATIAPFVAERSIVRWDEPRRAKALERWRAIARAAAKQARSPWLATIEPIAPGVPELEALVLHEDATVRLRDALPHDPPVVVHLVVGPEGGLAPTEMERLCRAGGRPVSLGERILRSDWAGSVGATIVSFVYGSLG